MKNINNPQSLPKSMTAKEFETKELFLKHIGHLIFNWNGIPLLLFFCQALNAFLFAVKSSNKSCNEFEIDVFLLP